MWKKLVRNLLSRRSPAPVRVRRQSLGLSVEVLEDRVTPSGFAASAGGLFADGGQAVAAGPHGEVYVAGKFQMSSPAAAPSGAFVAKYAPGGTPQWMQHIRGDVTDDATALAVDAQGNAYVTGVFHGSADFGNGQTLTSGPNANGFIEKLDTFGQVQWVKGIYAPNSAGGGALALDSNANVYTTGYLNGSADFFGHAVSNPTNQGTSFLLKQDTNGNFLFVQQFGIPDPTGSPGDLSSANAIAVNAAGNAIYVGGAFRGTNVQFGTNLAPPHSLSALGTTDIFAEKFDAQGNAVWAVRAGSTTILEGSPESANGIALDSNGTPYITGSFDNTADFGNLQLIGVNGPNTFVAKLDPTNGNFLNAVTFAAAGEEVGTAIAADQAGNLYATGFFAQTATFGPLHLTTRGDEDVYLAKLDANLNVLCVTQLGGEGRDRGFGVAVDSVGFVDVTGSFNQSGQFLNSPPVTLTSAGDTDVFVTRMRMDCSPTHVSVLDGHILRLQGDDTADRIALTDDGHGSVVVALDNDAARTYRGIDRIEVRAGGGNDVVSYQLGGPNTIGNPDFRPADLMVDLGKGDDQFTLTASFGLNTPPDPERTWHVDLNAGDGNDQVMTNIQGSVPVLMSVDLGKGDDRSIYEFHDVENMPNPERLTVHGGPGGDDIRVIYGFNPQPEPPGRPQSAPIVVSIDGDGGDDRIGVDYSIGVDSGSAANLPGNPGDPLVFSIQLATNVRGGEGNDDIRVTHGFIIHDGQPGLRIAAPITTNIDGGAGADHIQVQFAHDPPEDRTAQPTLAIDAALAFHVNGGAGDDFIGMSMGDNSMPGTIQPTMLPGSSLNVVLDGGAGNDMVQAMLTLDPRSMGRVNAHVLGGPGNDDLTLNIYGIGNPDFLTALIDGGAGLDVAHHTSNVRAVNCER